MGILSLSVMHGGVHFPFGIRLLDVHPHTKVYHLTALACGAVAQAVVLLARQRHSCRKDIIDVTANGSRKGFL
jgi:hypothetical protein